MDLLIINAENDRFFKEIFLLIYYTKNAEHVTAFAVMVGERFSTNLQ